MTEPLKYLTEDGIAKAVAEVEAAQEKFSDAMTELEQAAARAFAFETEPGDRQWTTPEQRAVAPAIQAGRFLQQICHQASYDAGWWKVPATGGDLREEVRQGTRLGKALVAEKLCLAHSELSEAMEGHRKGRMDDKLPHRPMIEVELADAVIRIADLAGALDLDLGGAIFEKMLFNAVREDHKIENRTKDGGKAY